MTGPYQQPDPSRSGQYSYPVIPGQAPVPDISAPQGVPTGPYPAPTVTGPYPVPQYGQDNAPPGGWSYGPPPGVMPDLVNTPIGQAGSLGNSNWQAKAAKGAAFPILVLAELRKLVGTFSDRLMLALAPLLLVGATIGGLQISIGLTPASAAMQVLGLVIAVEAGHLMVHTTLIKTMCGEWHYRSVQLTLLLQPRRLRFVAAQVSMLAVVWAVLTAIQFLVFYPLATSWIGKTSFQLYLDQRIGWVLGITALGTFLSLLFCLVVAYLLPNPTAAVTVYFIGKIGVGLLLTNAALSYLSPYASLQVLAGFTDDVVPAITGTVLWIGLLVLGVVITQRRDAR